MKNILKKLTDVIAISGEEDLLFNTVKDIVKDINVKVSIDNMGSITIFRKGEKKGKIWMSAHADEIGLIVTKIDGNYIRFSQVGGYDEKVLLGQEVTVYGDKPYNGIIGAKPPHLMTADEYSKLLGFSDLYIDIAMNEKEIKKHIKIGDRIAIRHKFLELKNDLVSTKSLDDRACGAIIIKTLMLLENIKNLPDIYVVLNSQEEVGLRGARTSAYSIFPDIAFITDVTFVKQPGMTFGHSIDEISIAKGATIHPKLFEHVKNIAEQEQIKYSIEPLPSRSGTDTGIVQTSRTGVATILVSLPVRNMHSPVETASLKTMEQMAKLLARSIESININDFKIKRIK